MSHLEVGAAVSTYILVLASLAIAATVLAHRPAVDVRAGTYAAVWGLLVALLCAPPAVAAWGLAIFLLLWMAVVEVGLNSMTGPSWWLPALAGVTFLVLVAFVGAVVAACCCAHRRASARRTAELASVGHPHGG